MILKENGAREKIKTEEVKDHWLKVKWLKNQKVTSYRKVKENNPQDDKEVVPPGD